MAWRWRGWAALATLLVAPAPAVAEDEVWLVAPAPAVGVVARVGELLATGLRERARALHRVPPDALAAAGSPALIVTVGPDALAATRAVRPDVPRIFALADDDRCEPTPTPGETGVLLRMNVAELLDALLTIAPDVRSVGFVRSPTGVPCTAGALRDALDRRGLVARERQASDPLEHVHAVRSMSLEIDALFLLPDPAVTSAETLRHAIQFGLEARRPVVAYSARIAEDGALLADRLEPDALAEQTLALVDRVLAGEPPGTIPRQLPTPWTVAVNRKTARVLRLDAGRLASGNEGGPDAR